MRKRSRCGCRRCDANRILISCQESRCTAETNADTGKRGRKQNCQQSFSHKTRSVITSPRSLAIRVSGLESAEALAKALFWGPYEFDRQHRWTGAFACIKPLCRGDGGLVA